MEGLPLMFLGIMKYGLYGFILVIFSYYLLKNKKNKPENLDVNSSTLTKTTPKGIISSVMLAVGLFFILMVILVIYYNVQDLKSYHG